MKKALLKDTVKEIANNAKRFISLILIVLLGVGFFAGIKATSPDMRNALDNAFDTQNVMDIQVLSTLGINQNDLEELQKIEGIEKVETSFVTDAVVNSEEKEEVVKLMTLPFEINKVKVVEGRLPENNKECVVEPSFLYGMEHEIGDVIKMEVENIENEEGEEQTVLKEKEVTIVGTVNSPLYISRDRGTTKLGAGKIEYYMYVPFENLNTEIRTVAYITVEGAKELKSYQKKYEDIVKQVKNKIEDVSKIRIQERYQESYDIAEKKIKDNEEELNKQKQIVLMLPEIQRIEAEKQIEQAQEKIDDAKAKLADIKEPEWYILDRNQNVGYVSYLQDADRIDNISKVFPVVFFVVAALISLTSMTRMVEEQRVQIGTLKALGYNKVQIASKYIIYASLATIVGSVLGVSIGFYLIPKIICEMYAMMYAVSDVILEFNIGLAIAGLLAAVVCTVGATCYSCIKALESKPATLMRPKAPKIGKRVFLEKIPFLWKHFNFTQKVTARNLFRYKKRFMMTIIGVAGCTSLIVAGFGLRDAVSRMIPSQYEDIFNYNLEITLKDNLEEKDIAKAYEEIKVKQGIQKSIKINRQSIEIVKNDNNQSIQLVVPEEKEQLQEFIQLHSRKNRENTYTLNEEGVILTEKIAKLLDIKEGDEITVKNIDNVEVQTKVIGITENYLSHYIYMSPELYKKLYQEKIKANTILAIVEEQTEEQENSLGKEILEDKEYVSSVVFTSMTKDIFEEVMNKLSLVVWILIIAAGLLVLVVLYNLSNTNISERIRELATIKVLGFYDLEVYQYVGKEMIILTIIGILIGLLGGNILTTYIIRTCELDAFMFNPQIKITSYLYGIVITLLFASIVNIITYFALKKINMIESLKSVE